MSQDREYSFWNSLLAYLSGLIISIPVEFLSLGSVEYPIALIRIPGFGFPVSLSILYGIYGITFVYLWKKLRVILTRKIENVQLARILAYILTSLLGMFMEFGGRTSGYWIYTDQLLEHHQELGNGTLVAVSIYFYYFFVINMPLLLMYLFLARTFARVQSVQE